ncbi:hypothetical protein D1872_50750 [compost metagenome]
MIELKETDKLGDWYPDFKPYADINSKESNESAIKALNEKQIKKTRQNGQSDRLQKRMDMDLFK